MIGLNLGLTYTQQNEFRPAILAVGTEYKTKDGVWLTRLKNALFKGHKYRPSEESLTALGALAQQITGRYRAKMDWEHGAYADPSSCYGSYNRQAPVALARIGVKFFTVEKAGNGIGRCMVWQRNGYALVFGAHGISVQQLARVIADRNGMEVHDGVTALTIKLPAGKNLYNPGAGRIIYKEGVAFPQSSRMEDHGYRHPCCSLCRSDTKGTFTASPDGRMLFCTACRPHYGGTLQVKYEHRLGYSPVGPKQID